MCDGLGFHFLVARLKRETLLSPKQNEGHRNFCLFLFPNSEIHITLGFNKEYNKEYHVIVILTIA